MKIIFTLMFVLLSSGLLSDNAFAGEKKWEAALKKELPLMGHRNFIVITDSAYPLQSSAGVITTFVDEPMIDVVASALAIVKASKHVSAKVYLDKELDFLSNKQAMGVEAYRDSLMKLVSGATVEKVKHEEIISLLDSVSEKFTVKIIKTPSILPYTSVFIELGAGYWDGAREKELRANMAK